MDQFFDEKKETHTWSQLLLPFLLLGFSQGVAIGSKQGSGDTKPEDVMGGSVRQMLEKRSLEHAAQVVGTTKQTLQDALDTAIKNGDSVKQFASTINDLYGESMGYRSMRIARTELTGAINNGTVATLADEGFTQKEWSTVMDGHERDSHAAVNGQTVAIDEPFKLAGGDGMYPGDESLPPEETVNCRCALVGSGMPEDRKKTLTDQFLRTHGALEKRFVVSLRRAFSEQRDRVLSQFPPR